MITCSKLYKDIPFAHRQHLHDGHCSQIHGHNWDIKLTFSCKELDAMGFVVDFGKLFFEFTDLLKKVEGSRAWIHEIEIFEDSKNSVKYRPPMYEYI